MTLTKQKRPIDCSGEKIDSISTKILESYAAGLWLLLGEGTGGVTNAAGKDLWQSLKSEAKNRGYKINIENSEEFLDVLFYLFSEVYNFVNKISADFDDDTLNIRSEGCKFHQFTDKLEIKGIPRELGCPELMIIKPMLREIGGSSYRVVKIDSCRGTCQIQLKKR